MLLPYDRLNSLGFLARSALTRATTTSGENADDAYDVPLPFSSKAVKTSRA